jgi:Zn-dependent M16 (insulinase) family peptidase
VPVASGAWAFRGVPYRHPDAPALTLLSRVLHERLHEQVRQLGGAYGATCRASAEQGLLLCASLRDPDIRRSLKLFQALPELVEPLTSADLCRARTSAARLLRPLTSLPGAARRAFLDAQQGYTPALRDAFYDQVASTQADDLRRVAGHYLRGGSGAVLAGALTLSSLEEHHVALA